MLEDIKTRIIGFTIRIAIDRLSRLEATANVLTSIGMLFLIASFLGDTSIVFALLMFMWGHMTRVAAYIVEEIRLGNPIWTMAINNSQKEKENEHDEYSTGGDDSISGCKRSTESD